MSPLVTIAATVHEIVTTDVPAHHWIVRFSNIGGKYVWSEPIFNKAAAEQLAETFNKGVSK